MSFFSVRDLRAGYGGQEILQGIGFSVEQNHLTGVLGANGSGKTTLLKAVCGILPHKGCCTLAGTVLERLSPRQLARQCGYIPQRSGISIDISALDVVLMGFNPHLRLLERPDAAMIAAARQALEQVGLTGMEEVNYLHLSEGQKQLCILARTLASDRRLLLLDEPESALDFRFRFRMLAALRDWLATGERCGLVTLHDPALALNFCDELLLLSGGALIGCICPARTPLPDMQFLLARLYGPVTLLRCPDRTGREQLVMLKEAEG